MPRKPKPVAAKAREMAERGADPIAIAKKLDVRPHVVERALARSGNRGRPREVGVPVRLRLPQDVIAAADARVTSESDRSAVLIDALRSAFRTDVQPIADGIGIAWEGGRAFVAKIVDGKVDHVTPIELGGQVLVGDLSGQTCVRVEGDRAIIEHTPNGGALHIGTPRASA